MALTNGREPGSAAVIYGCIALLSVALLVGYCLLEKKKERKFLLLYTSVSVVNCGYFLLSVAMRLETAMLANRISYLGAAYSILIMLLIILDVCRFQCPRSVGIALTCISTGAFLLAASGNWLGLYYSQVSLETVNGVTTLVKEYGPLHILYPVYLFSYFAIMVTAIVYAAAKGKITSPKYAAFLAAIALGNLGIWFVEQLVDVDFEFLSVSYVATELFLLLLYSMLREYGLLQSGSLAEAPAQAQDPAPAVGGLPPDVEELFDTFAGKVGTLSAAERRILNYYIDGHEIGEIPELAYISIHTVKKHNRSIYQKLGVASRDELMLYIDLFRRCGRLDDLTQKSE